LVARYAPTVKANIVAESSSHTSVESNPFLWQAIYPKFKSQRPYYNPSGKYCVKLFLAGKWRKVTVSDVLPVEADGRPAIASSSEAYELWPSSKR